MTTLETARHMAGQITAAERRLVNVQTLLAGADAQRDALALRLGDRYGHGDAPEITRLTNELTATLAVIECETKIEEGATAAVTALESQLAGYVSSHRAELPTDEFP